MSIFRAVSVVFLGVLTGCGAAPMASTGAAKTEAPTAPSAAHAEPANKASQGAPPAAESKAEAPKAAAPSSSESAGARSSIPFASLPEIADSPGAPELEAGAKSAKKESWAEARPQIERAIPAVEAGGRLDALIAAHALLGRSCSKLNDARCAEKAFQRAIELWEAPGAADKLRAAGGDEAGQQMARALTAVGEARFSLAEQKRKDLDAIRFPEYKGADTKEEVTRFTETKVAEWISKKTAKVEEVEGAYRKVFEMAPEPPPRFAVAAAARMGQIWGKFGAELRAAPIPAGWKSTRMEELRKFYYSKLDAMADPIKAAATAKFERCRAVAGEVNHKDDFSRTCEVWLQKNQAASAPGGPSPAPITRAP